MLHRAYLPYPITLGDVEIRGPEAHHLAHVCRVRPGESLALFNGDGSEYRGQVMTIGRHSIGVRVESVGAPAREPGYRLEVAAPLPKADRGKFLIEKLTELGVSAYVPLRTERSVVHPALAHCERLKRQVIEASKQCGRNTLMEVREVATWAQYLSSSALPDYRVVAHRGGQGLLGPRSEPGDIAIAVGPEGGFSDGEIACARQAGWQIVGMGPRILRVETAAMVLAAWGAGVIPRAPQSDTLPER
jgi:16S rRNA (uracil1498-N3)-methyltransferase